MGWVACLPPMQKVNGSTPSAASFFPELFLHSSSRDILLILFGDRLTHSLTNPLTNPRQIFMWLTTESQSYTMGPPAEAGAQK